MQTIIDSRLDRNPNIKHEIFWRLKDRHYLSLWDKRDLPIIEKCQEKIRKTHDEQLLKEFFKNLDRKWDDHRSNFNCNVEPLDLSLKDDVLTFRGIGRMCRLITKQDTTSFGYVAIGTGAGFDVTPMPFDQDLVSESAKIATATNGFFDATGTSIRYGGTFGATVASADYNESLIRDTSNAGDGGRITLCISMFQANPIHHTFGDTGFTAAGSLEFQPIADLDTIA